MRRKVLGISTLILSLTVTCIIIAATPAKKSCNTAVTVKSGALCPKPVKSKTVKKPMAKKVVVKAAMKPVAPKVVALPRLVDLGATSCIPCKMMTPILGELTNEYKGKLTVEFIDVRINSGAAQKYGIQAIPTQIFYNANGKELYRHQGFYPKADIIAKLNEFGIKPKK